MSGVRNANEAWDCTEHSLSLKVLEPSLKCSIRKQGRPRYLAFKRPQAGLLP